MLVIGSLLLVAVVGFMAPPLFCGWHFVNLDVKIPTGKFFNFGGVSSHVFRFRTMGFDQHIDNKTAFDELYLIKYVYGSLGKAGDVVTNEAHLLSHFNHAALSTPIVPIHADNTIRDLMSGVKKRTKYSDIGSSAAEV